MIYVAITTALEHLHDFPSLILQLQVAPSQPSVSGGLCFGYVMGGVDATGRIFIWYLAVLIQEVRNLAFDSN